MRATVPPGRAERAASAGIRGPSVTDAPLEATYLIKEKHVMEFAVGEQIIEGLRALGRRVAHRYDVVVEAHTGNHESKGSCGKKRDANHHAWLRQ